MHKRHVCPARYLVLTDSLPSSFSIPPPFRSDLENELIVAEITFLRTLDAAAALLFPFIPQHPQSAPPFYSFFIIFHRLLASVISRLPFSQESQSLFSEHPTSI
jgi:hypothetical protein